MATTGPTADDVTAGSKSDVTTAGDPVASAGEQSHSGVADIGGEMIGIGAALDAVELDADCKVGASRGAPRQHPLSPLRRRGRFVMRPHWGDDDGMGVTGMTVNPAGGTLVVRSNHLEYLAVYAPAGDFLHVLGRQAEGVITVYPGCQSVCLDTTRGRYLIPTTQGELLLLDLQGAEIARVSVCPDHVLSGICCTGQYYFTSSVEPGRNVIYRIDGDSHKVEPLCTPFEMGYAMDMCGHVDTAGDPLLAVCDFECDVLYVLDIQGNVKHAIHQLFKRDDDVTQRDDDKTKFCILEDCMEVDAEDGGEKDEDGDDDDEAAAAAAVAAAADDEKYTGDSKDECDKRDDDPNAEYNSEDEEETEEDMEEEYTDRYDSEDYDLSDSDDDDTSGHMYDWLRRPAACCAGPDGRFLLTDRNRKRILTFGESEDGEITFTPIVSGLRAPPGAFTCDLTNRLLFVSYDDDVIDVFEEIKDDE